VLVVVAADTPQAPEAQRQLRSCGATQVTEAAFGARRTLVYGGPFDDRLALDVATALRAQGWPADMRPEGGGHLSAWQAHTRPVRIDDRLTVCFPWSEFDRDQTELVVEIDPGRAFGTGAHPTTRLLLTELAARIQGGESVLDVGCGTGVLAIAAARLGATQVTAIDIEPKAIASTTSNAKRNGVADRVLPTNTPLDQLTTTFDVVLANIHAEALLDLSPAIQRRLAPNGWLALSGMSPAQVSRVAAA
jgi:ribosomal protein L11 methyltransferase